jgi:CRP-like cAMP-binding protein
VTGSTAFLSRLGEADRAALSARWNVSNFARDEMVVAHDEQGRDVFFVVEGRARATVFSESGRVVAYRDMEAGDIFGELSAIDGNARSASVVALEDMRVARLSGSAFREIVKERPTFAWALLEHLSAQMRRMTDRIYEFSTMLVRERLIRELLRLSEASGDVDEQARITPAPTHFELAARISTHREAVSREMSALAKLKLVRKSGDSLLLIDMKALRKLARSTR